MARNYGDEYPERPLMAVLSDLLSIPHYTTSRGATVRSDFLREVLSALGGVPQGLSKDELIRACVEASTGASFDPDLISVGGTVTNAALQAMVDGITRRHPGRANLDGDSLHVDVWFPQSELEYNPTEVRDERERRLAERAMRLGQDQFRTSVLNAYSSTCALTGTDAVSALEAAHITPYMGPQSNVIGNGICLRADMHRLWDNGLVALDEQSFEIVLLDALRATSYREIEGQRARVPHHTRGRPSRKALAAHREWCGIAV